MEGSGGGLFGCGVRLFEGKWSGGWFDVELNCMAWSGVDWCGIDWCGVDWCGVK